MRNIAFFVIFLFSIGSFSFSPRPDPVADFKGMLKGVWKIESLKVKRVFAWHKVKSPEADFYIRFDPSGEAHILDAATRSPVSSGTWTITCSETVIASDPFVYREDPVITFNFAIPQMSIQPGTSIFLEPKHSGMIVRYFRNHREYRAKLVLVP